MYDAAVIGGGFYGTAIAAFLAKERGFESVALIEQDEKLMQRASYNNQARIHNGYHYPRSFLTGIRSRVNLPRFVRDYPDAIKRDFVNLYAIAKQNSKVTAHQFRHFCLEIGVPLEAAPSKLRTLFEPRLIEDVFITEEYVFHAGKLAESARAELQSLGVELRLNTRVSEVKLVSGGWQLTCESFGRTDASLEARFIFNCTYSGLNQLKSDAIHLQTLLKHEICEMAQFKVPEELAQIGVTVMDGPFFSLMPFPAKQLHSLSHVRYTPHSGWNDTPKLDPYRTLASYPKDSRADRMLRDASRYLPAIAESQYVDSMFEIKTVLSKSDGDDGRPILFEKHPNVPRCYSILGGKIDNIYDCLEALATDLSRIRQSVAS